MIGSITEHAFAAVLFDLDGTLIDSTPIVRASWAQWATEYAIAEEYRTPRHGWPARAIVEAIAAAGGLDPDQIVAATRRIEDIEVTAPGRIDTMPGAVAALAAIPADRAAIVTSCTVALAEARLAATDLRPPAVIVTADQVQHGKPAPDAFLRAAELLGVDPGDCLVVEDAPAGLEAGRAAGCVTLGLETTTPAGRLHADLVVADLAAVTFSVDGGVRMRLVAR